MVQIIIHGFNGNVGKILQEIIEQDSETEVIAGIDSFACESQNKYPVYTSFSDEIPKADVIIDFSHYSTTPALLEYCTKSKTPVVLATTGLDDTTYELINIAAEIIPVFQSFNMSLGINILAEAIKTIVPQIEDNFNIEIIEKHHNKKVDSPSGTALFLADSINEACIVKKNYVFGRHSKNDTCEITDLGIHAIRGGTIPGEHTIIFAGNDEIIEIKHTALSKRIFATGALKAAKFIAKSEKGLYNMSDLFSEGKC